MKVSQLRADMLSELTIEQVDRIVFHNCTDDGQSGAAAILLGGNPNVLRERASAAARLYHEGRVPYIIPTGGVKWDTDLGRMSEAERMEQYLLEFGVPQEAILLENEATTTRENMIFATLLIERRLKPRGPFRLVIVTSPAHLRRSLAIAKMYLPRTAEISGCPGDCPQGMPGVWHQDEYQVTRVQRELGLIKEQIDQGDMDDFEF
ncbi:MAG: YdcF family protein [Clostridia bacterium]|nr:YdcF family protein [Clostridia bacterium]MBQ4085325.1 YdcF family protein [Clostridia bacterium]